MTKQKHIQCPYCHANASLRPASTVYGCNRRSQGKYIYLCDRWPACDAYVSAHDRTHRPMGTLANGDLRHKRILAHRALEHLQQSRHMEKWEVYIWLQAKLGLNDQQAHKVMEYIRGISVLRSFSKGDEGQREVRAAFQEKWDADYGQEKATAGVLRFYGVTFKLMSCVLIAAAALLYLAGQISLPYCLTFLFCAFTVYSDLETMGNSAFLSKKINTELDRLEEVTDIPKMDASSEKLVVSHYDISLEHISFGYGDRRVIHDISLEIPEHTTCAIVGPSGSGKTTLCNLIARFWDVQEGTVRIGGKDVRDYTADSVLEYISMVFQNVYLFHDSVENNIRFGRPEATHEQVVAAAKRACCHDFILSLPEGYDTIIGEGGSTLSGGEKQRISIARAILKDAPIIILDEATSSVDPENEQALLSAIQELTKDKTLISIAHRLSTVRNADQIIVIDQGRVVQQGKHNELLQKDGIYRKFLSLRTRATGWHL